MKDQMFFVEFPELLDEWLFERNSINPRDIKLYSNKKAWWICPKGHEYEMLVCSRARGMKCPVCASKKVLEGYNDLLTQRPSIALSWDYNKNTIKPNEVTISSNKKVWWKCRKGHEWKAMINSRTQGRGCPCCNGKRVIAGETDLFALTKNRIIISEWNYNRNTIKPTEVSPNSNKKAWWICKKGHEWEAAISSRNLGSGCPYCSGKRAIEGETDLATLNPELVQEWNFAKNTIKPTEVTVGSNKKVWWKCGKGHEWEATIKGRTGGSGCPYCSGKKVMVGETDLLTLNPELAKQWNYKRNEIKPTEVTVGSNKKVWWKCEKGHDWEAPVYSRKVRGCPYCANQKSCRR